MGLFGLFYTLFGIGCKGVSNINDAVKDNENRTIYSTWYKQKLYYERTSRPWADSLKDKFIEEGEARVKYKRSEKARR